MKKQLLTLLLLTAITAAFAQNSLRSRIITDRGLTTHFIVLDQTEQAVFDASKLHTILGLDANSDLVLLSTETDQIGGVHYRYQQTYQGIPVENSMYIIHTKNGLITGMSGSMVMDFDSQMPSRFAVQVQKPKAIAGAVSHVGATKYMWQDAAMEQRAKLVTNDQHASYYPKAELVWYNAGDEINPRELRLAYKVDVYALQPVSRADIFVDAQTGKILGEKCRLENTDATGPATTAYSGTQTIHSDLSGSSYRLRDYTKGNGVITLRSNGTDYTSSTSTWTLSTPDKYALDAHFGVAATYTYYLNNFSRNSLNNAGIALTSYVNDGGYSNNAAWDGSAMHFGNVSGSGAGITAIDVAGHELTHGVTQYTCNLNYSYQSGAMNESMSDIMGKSVQFYTKPADVNWLLSNDMNWSIRNMSSPNSFSQPDTYLGTYWTNSSSDNGGVHTNSGVGNFMFYLLVTGGSGTNDIGNAYTVTGIGLAEADQIIYRTQTVYLTSTSQYADWRTACINAATDLYGSTSNEVIQVENAWYAVGIGTSGGGGGGCGTPGGLNATAITSSSATLNWGSVSGATSYNVQYRVVGNATWTSTTSTTTSKAISGLAANTTYEFQVQTVCSGGSSSFSGSATFTTLSSGGISYCASNGTSQAYEYIDYVNLGTISRTSGADAGGYYNGTSLSTNVTQGTGYTLTRSAGFVSSTYTEYWAVYVDWNEDGDFADANETALTGTTSGSGNYTGTITVPSTATVGTTRMRVSMHYGGTPASCGSFDYGEVEDYTLNVQAGNGGSCTNSNEPNNTSGTATPVSVGIDILSQIGSSTDVDWYSFNNSSSASNIKVTLGTLPGDYDIRLYNTAGSNVVVSQNGGTSSETMIYNTSTVGTYKIKVYGYAGAYSTTQCYTMHIFTSSSPFRLSDENLANSDANSSVKLYPNPASNQMTMQYNGEEALDATLRITDVLGQIVSVSQQHLESGSAMPLDISKLNDGKYFISIVGNNFQTVKMFEVIR
ncbi:MAG TPA: M4 family metallopeptidase [Chitinophagales bacterium]|nr:M4 family metallopeptidase [Chitinophagales bacterium]